ncbi:MAG: hypothetical protein M1840_005775 [Geoglossum simile]|nr:MAG: hypothetical protein M1840_005775 [Geoglossum simile]
MNRNLQTPVSKDTSLLGVATATYESSLNAKVHTKMLRRLILSFATKNCSNLTKHVVSKPSIVTRSFHINPSYRSNCDFGSPCNCTECTENTKRPICEVCRIRPTVNQSSEPSRDRKGISSYTFTSSCEQCLEYTEGEREREREKERTLALRKKKADKMMKYVRVLYSTEQVPISYAVEKLLSDIRSTKSLCNSRRWYQQHLVNCLSQDLQIVKVQNGYMCNKQRVDAMDFKLWFFHQWLYIDVLKA